MLMRKRAVACACAVQATDSTAKGMLESESMINRGGLGLSSMGCGCAVDCVLNVRVLLGVGKRG